MRFSIIVPVYNAADYLESAISSVLAQNMHDWELLLVDDGSTDGATGALCDHFAAGDNRIHALHKENGGAGDARNYGIDRARGDYLLFLDSDDRLEPHALQILDAQLAETPVALCYFGFIIQTGEQETTQQPSGHAFGSVFTLADAPDQLLSAPSAWCAAWKRTLFTANTIRFRPRGWGEDLAMTRKMLALAESIVLIPDILYRYVIRDGSITTSRNLDANAEIMEALSDVLTWFQARGLTETYREELCILCLNNIYDACVRIVRADAAHPLPDQLMQFLRQQFPAYRENAYLQAWGAKRKLVLSLLEKRRYKMARALFRGV